MKRQVFNTLLLATFTVLLWLLNAEYKSVYLEKSFYTLLALLVIYVVFRVVFTEIVGAGIREPKSRYHFRKALFIVHIVVILASIVTIWVENPQALVVAYGIIGAGVTVALQDVFKNIAGGITIFLTGVYQVGERVEINGKQGDVIDVGIMYTTLLELGEWVAGDQATGRLSIVPNGAVLSGTVNSYTKDNPFIWDEIVLPVTYDSDWKFAVDRFMEVIRSSTGETVDKARAEASMIERKYYLPKRALDPAIYLAPNDNWITFHIRYLVEARERRAVKDSLSRMLLEVITGEEKIDIASTTLDITAFPAVDLWKN